MATKVAGELYESITGQLFEIGRQLRQPNGYPFSPSRLKIALQNAIEGKFVDIRKQPAFSVLATTKLGAVARKPTKKCFADFGWEDRDCKFDDWLSVNQGKADACSVSLLASSEDWTLTEAINTILGMEAGMDTALLGSLLVKDGHAMTTLAQVEEIVEKAVRGGEASMYTSRYGNCYFFVETGDPRWPVLVGSVSRVERVWSASVFGFSLDYRLTPGCRLLVRNLDASKLGL